MIRTTIDVPEPLYETLRSRSERTGASMRSLIVKALEVAYGPEKKADMVTGPLVKGKGRLGPLGEGGANVNDFLLS